MAKEWYYTKSGQQQGPIGGSELKQLAASGKLSPSDLVWREGLAEAYYRWAEMLHKKGDLTGAEQMARRAAAEGQPKAPGLLAGDGRVSSDGRRPYPGDRQDADPG